MRAEVAAQLRALLVLLALLGAGAAQADAIHIGHFSLLPAGAGQHELLADLPADMAAPTSAIEWPEGCRATAMQRQTFAGRTRLSLGFACAGPLAPDAVVHLPWRLDGASLRRPDGDAISVVPQPRGLDLPLGASLAGPQSWTGPWTVVARDFLWQGIIHILTGWDHLAFVLCLCLLASGGRRLLLLVTLFTLGHSVSLSAGFLDWVRLPMPPVEAVIALSILFMAREALLRQGENGFTRQALITSGFGLLHGLGFASALGEMAVPADDRLLALLFFTLGVETGQLLFVAAVLALMALAARIGQARWLRAGALHGAGMMAAFWLFERVAGFA